MSVLDQLDLTNNELQDSLPVLRPGVYMVTATEEETVAIKNTQNYKTTVSFTDDGGLGQITHVFNIKHSNPEAQRISRDQLKTFLTFGGHSNPDKPGSAPIKGLPAKVVVEKDGVYTDRNGNQRDSFKIKRFLRLDSPVALGATPDAGTSRSAQKSQPTYSSDDIPF